jgi:hypothetical protein
LSSSLEKAQDVFCTVHVTHYFLHHARHVSCRKKTVNCIDCPIKDNVSDHLKNKINCKNDESIIIISNIFGSNGLFEAVNKADFDMKATEISTEHPEFDSYFQTHIKN